MFFVSFKSALQSIFHKYSLNDFKERTAFGNFLGLILNLLIIIWPLLVIQSTLRAVLIVSSINQFLFAYLATIPFVLLAGLCYDIMATLHIAVLLVCITFLLPHKFKDSYIGKILIFFVGLIVSAILMFTFWAEIIAWVTDGIRIGGNDFAYLCIKYLHNTLAYFNVNNIYLKILAILTAVGLPSFVTTRIVCSTTFANNGIFVHKTTKNNVTMVLAVAGFLICTNIYHSRFDLTSSIVGIKNRYVEDCSRSAVYDSIINIMSNLWSINKGSSTNNEDVKRIVRKLQSLDEVLFLDDESDLYSYSPLKAVLNKDIRKNLLIVLLNNNSGNFISSKIIYGKNKPFEEETTTRAYAKDMPYFSRILKQSHIFCNYHASSNNERVALSSTMLSMHPAYAMQTLKVGVNNVFSLPNLLKAHGYGVSAFVNSKDLDLDTQILKSSGFNVETLPSCRIRLKKFGIKSNTISTNNLMQIVGLGKQKIGKEGSINNTSITDWDRGINNTNNCLDGFVLQQADQAFNAGLNFAYLITLSSALDGKKLTAHNIDNAIATIIENSKQYDWFEETIFVFVGTKGGSNHTKWHFNLNNIIVPFIIFDPSHETGKTTQSIQQARASTLDFAPTIASIMGISYISKFSGLDMSSKLPNKTDRGVVVFNGKTTGFIKNNTIVAISPYKKIDIYTKKQHKTTKVTIDGNDLTNQSSYNFEETYKPVKPFSYLLKKSKITKAASYCENCKFTNVAFNAKKLSWFAGEIYKKPMSSVSTNQYNSINKEFAHEVSVIEAIALQQNAAYTFQKHTAIEYNTLQ